MKAQQEEGETELALYPDDWIVVKLAECCNVENGFAFRSEDYVKEGMLNFRVVNITDNFHINVQTDVKFLPKSFEKVYEKYMLSEGDILLVMVGATRGKLAFITGNILPALLNQNMWKISPFKKNVNKKFLFYFLVKEVPIFMKRGSEEARGFFKKEEFRNVKVHIPTLPEQLKIAFVLSMVQTAIEKTENVINALNELKKALTKHLFIYGTVSFEEAERVKLRETDIGMIPEEWQLKELGLLLKECYRYPTYYSIQYVKEGVPEIRGELLLENGKIETDRRKYRFISKETAGKFSKVRLEEGDLVLSVRGTMGKIGYVTKELEGGVITANLIRLSPKQEFVRNDYLKRYLLSEGFQTNLDILSSKTTIKTIQASTLKSIKVPLPPFQEQEKISSILSTVDEKIGAEEETKGTLDELLKSMLFNLMSAMIRVNNLEA